MNWASKHEPFLLSMAKYQKSTKLRDFLNRLFFNFLCFFFLCVKILLNEIPTHYQMYLTDIAKWVSHAPEPEPFRHLRWKWQKYVTYSKLWHTFANEQEEKKASQPHKIDQIFLEHFNGEIFIPIGQNKKSSRNPIRYRGRSDPRTRNCVLCYF